jgi:tetratricopeptide (TPR) repeat protein
VISLTSLKVPKDARKEFDKGRELGDKKKFDEGLVRLKKAVELYPSYAEAYNEMGLFHKRQALASTVPEERTKQMGSAEEMYRKAIEADPKWIGAYLNLAQTLMMRNNFKECEETTQKALTLDSGSIDALYMQAYAQANLGKLDEAEKSALSAERGERRIPLVQWLLGRIYEVQGAPTKAVVRYKQYLKENPNATNAEQVKQSIAKLEQK